MKNTYRSILAFVALAIFAVSTATPQAQDYTYTTNNGTITITKYTGPGGDVVIPETIDGLPVTSIGHHALAGCTSLTSITVPNYVTTIGSHVFYGCAQLCEINVDGLNPIFSSWDGVLFDKTQTTLLQCPEGRTGSYTIPTGVLGIGFEAFLSCSRLTNVSLAESVTRIESDSFRHCISLESITIPNSVTFIGELVFWGCTNLTSINVGAQNPVFSSLNGVLFDRDQTTLIEYPPGRGGTYTIPESVISIGERAFEDCAAITNVTINSRVTGIGWMAFDGCIRLTAVYFQGDAPSFDSGWTHDPPFGGTTNATIYYLPGTIGWGTTCGDGGRPTAPWVLPYPVILTTAPNFGIQTNQFGFRISWATNAFVVVEACTNLAIAVWSPVSVNTLTEGWTYFSDVEWTNYPARFYRVRQW